MRKVEGRILPFVVVFTAALVVATAMAAARSEPAAQPEPARASPHVLGTVSYWNGDRLEVKTPDGKTEKIAVNKETKRQVEIKTGVEVAVEYRRRIGGFIIAERVLPAAAVQAEAAPAAAAPGSVTGTVVTWNNAVLILKTAEGDINLALSPSTEYRVTSLDPGLLVIVDYQEGSDHARLATLVRVAPAPPAEPEAGEAPEAGASEPAQDPKP